MLQRLQVREAALEMVADERTAELNALRQSLKAKELAMARMTEEVRGVSVASKWSATHWMRPRSQMSRIRTTGLTAEETEAISRTIQELADQCDSLVSCC